MKTFRRAVVFGLLALAAPFAALPLAKPATTDFTEYHPTARGSARTCRHAAASVHRRPHAAQL